MLHVGPGIRSWRCLRQWANMPLAFEAWEAFLWWEKGQLSTLCRPGEVPNKLIEAVKVINYEYGRAHRAYKDRQ